MDWLAAFIALEMCQSLFREKINKNKKVISALKINDKYSLTDALGEVSQTKSFVTNLHLTANLFSFEEDCGVPPWFFYPLPYTRARVHSSQSSTMKTKFLEINNKPQLSGALRSLKASENSNP